MPLVSVVLIPLLLASAPPAATDLRKCVGATGAVSYQTLPCAEGARQAWVQPIKPGSAPPPPKSQASSRPRSQPSPQAPAKTARRPAPRRASAADLRRQRCEKARREADDLRDRLWNKLDFQQRSELDAKVARACAR
ncbi:hypothetical protein [Arenimonas donghaensis]|uniref:DUF4124 domain-containing protein n=1 Tax=Arenimonas donghaensis DSM 18148 = HO3-R19 TaxID=1121014 RepID=A0A087MJS2_9GAMM|nr:hypothetical protein [Arenimonas donghaensis]KFL37125.1 hypothetical protein N788_11405 [Arenimonas donghaensis DSM 18148 = HO3-R19]